MYDSGVCGAEREAWIRCFCFTYSHGVCRCAMSTERLPRRSKRTRLVLFSVISGEGHGLMGGGRGGGAIVRHSQVERVS